MIILRQKNYSRSDEIRWAAGSIGRGALVGGGLGALIGPKKDPKRVLIRAGIGAAIGAGIGAKVYANGYQNRKRIEKEEPHKQEVDKIIEKNFKWALDYLKEIDKKIEQENNKLKELGKKLFSKSIWKDNNYFYDLLYFVPIYNKYNHLSDYIADLGPKSDNNLISENEDVSIVYNESTNQLELINYMDKPIKPIKNKTSLRDIVKKYYFDSIIASINYILNHPGDIGLDYGEYSLVWNDPEITEEVYYKALDTYCNEIKRFIKTI